jgi:hypothetical protein
VGAAGDMIRNGADPSIIPKIIAWREQMPEIGHMTDKALEGLQQKINEMGIDKFRALDDGAARELYQGIAEKGSVPADVAGIIHDYVGGTTVDRHAIETMATMSPDAKAALEALKPYKMPPPNDADDKPEGMRQPLSPADQEIQRQLSDYHPAALLKDRAFSDSGKITPLTLAKAYGELQDELHENLDRQPDNKLWQAQASKLQQTFINTVGLTNYIEENASRGVDILKAEPLLKGLAPPAPETPAKTSDTTAPVRTVKSPSASM